MMFLYLLAAGASVFCFCVGKVKAGIDPDEYGIFGYFFTPIFCGVFWPVGWMIYVPYLAAVWYIKKRKE